MRRDDPAWTILAAYAVPIAAGCAALAWSARRRHDRPTRWQRQALKSAPVSFPDWDTIQLRDWEKDAFADLWAGYFQREDAS